MQLFISIILLLFPIPGNSIGKTGGLSAKYYPKNEISASELLIDLENSGFKRQAGLYINNYVLKDTAYKAIKINTLSDTIYFKMEYYRCSDIETPSSIAVWNKKYFIYKTDKGNDPQRILNCVVGPDYTVENYRKYNAPFFKLVEKWDTVTMRAAEYKLGHPSPTVVNMVIFKNHTLTLDSFKFFRLYLDEMGDKAMGIDFNILSNFRNYM